MASLTTQSKEEVAGDIMRYLSLHHEEIPLTAPQVVAGITVFDDEVAACEAAILAALPAGPANWLTAHPEIARRIMRLVADKRRETL